MAAGVTKLYLEPRHREVVSFDEKHHAHFSKSYGYYEEIFKAVGIAIPVEQEASYGNKRFVKLNDPEFERAFREIYWEYSMDHTVFVWK